MSVVKIQTNTIHTCRPYMTEGRKKLSILYRKGILNLTFDPGLEVEFIREFMVSGFITITGFDNSSEPQLDVEGNE